MNTGETIALIKAFGNGGSSLPSVTSSDNGKVLAVKDGAWAADSNLFLVTVTNNSSDKSKTEIVDAVNAGKVVVATKSNSTYSFNYYDTTNAYFSKTSSAGSANILRINQNKVATEFYKRMVPDFGVSDEGKTLKLKDDSGSAIMSWEPTKFLVTLTPTAQDFSGTMDKTVAEINAAYEAGQEIWFKILTGANTYMEIPLSEAYKTSAEYPSFNAFAIDIFNNVIINAYTGNVDDGTKQTYSAKVYSLTPAS